MRRLLLLFVGLALFGQPIALSAQSGSIFVPLWTDHAAKDVTIDSVVARYAAPGSEQRLIHVGSAYGDVYVNSVEDCERQQARLLPGYGVAEGLRACAGLALNDVAPVGFIEVIVPAGQSLHPSVWYSGLEFLGGVVFGQDPGQPIPVLKQEIQLPTYDSLFPPGVTAVSPPVFLGRFQTPEIALDAPAYRHARRVHLLLLNAGAEDTAFHVVIRPIDHGTPLGEADVDVAARSVVFAKNVADERRWEGSSTFVGNAAWIEVTADQPFLGLVITEIDDAGVGDAKFQAYALRAQSGRTHSVVSDQVAGPPVRRH